MTTVQLRALGVAVVVGTLLRWPALEAGFREDDYAQLAMIEGAFPIQRGALDLFWFSGASSDEHRAMLDAGYLPWWSDPELRIGMLRPLSSLLVWADHTLLGARAPWHHVHSLVWWVALMACAATLFARLLPVAAACAAIALYALDEAHSAPLGWLANRSTLVATSFGVIALTAHVRWREHAWRIGPWVVAGAAALAVCAGEYALGVLAYVPAYELCRARDGARTRLVSLLPASLPAAAYVAVRAALGHGVRGSGFYLSPFEPAAFVPEAALRIPALTGDAVLGIPAGWWMGGPPWRGWILSQGWFAPDTWRRLPSWHAWQVALGVSAAVLVLWASRRLVRAAPAGGEHVRWLLVGALFSLVPAAGSLPSTRLLAGAGLGIAAFVALLLVEAWRAWRTRAPGRRTLGALALGALVMHGGVAAERAWAHAESLHASSAAMRRYALDAEIPRDGIESLDVLVVSASDFTTAAHVPWVRRAHGLGLPRSYRRLSGAMRAHDLTRVAPHVLELEVLAADVGSAAAGSLYRPASSPIAAGDRFELRGMRVDVLEARDGNPARMRFTFDAALDTSGRYLILAARPEGLIRLELPEVSKTLRLPAAAYPPPLP